MKHEFQGKEWWKIKVLLLGLSNKQDLEPFDSSTNSGKIVDMIIKKLPDITFEKRNIVPYAPLDKNGKLRYPNKEELIDGNNSLAKIIDEFDCVVLFGKIVQDTINNNHRFGHIKKICAKHPSYIWVYKRKLIEEYVNQIFDKIRFEFRQ